MKQFYFYVCWLLITAPAMGQKVWSGNGGDPYWSNPGNWIPTEIPAPGEDIILNNNFQNGDYTVLLPSGSVQTTINSIAILPAEGKSITLILPPDNSAAPALIVNGEGNSFIIGKGGIFKNSSGAPSGDAVNIVHSFCIYNGGRYIHNTSRGNAQIIDRLSADANTEKGIFEFDVPGSAGYTVSLTGNTFGSLYFSASSGTKSYSGNGVSPLKIRGDLKIGAGATVTSTLTSDIHLYGNLEMDGSLHLNPSTPGTSNRNLILYGNPSVISGNGQFHMNAHFRSILCAASSEYHLERSVVLPNSANQFTVQQGAALYPGGFAVSGTGRFILEEGSGIYLEKTNGIAGNILTDQAIFSPGANYYFIAGGDQYTGTNFPDEILNLKVDKDNGQLILSKNLHITGNLELKAGCVKTSPDAVLTLYGAVESPANQYGETNAGHENSFVDGPVQVVVQSGGSITVPVGKNEHFAPVMINKLSSGNGNYRVEYFPQSYPVPNINTLTLHHVSKKEYWKIEPADNSAGQDVQLTLSWRPYSAVSNDAAERNDLRVAINSGDKWEIAGNTLVISGNENYGIISNVTTVQMNSVFTIGSASAFNILPLQGLNLQTRMLNEKVELQWTFESDEENEYVQPEKSNDGRSYRPIRKIFYTGTGRRRYTFIDSFPFQGPNYYRIGVKPKDDSIVYSPVSYIVHEAKTQIRIYPNPASDHINIFFSGKSSSFEYVIVNSYGSVINRKQKLKEDLTRIPLTGLPPGKYTLIIYKNKEVIALPFLK